MSLTIRRRPAVVTAGALGTAALALATSGTLSGFTASITNSADTAGAGTLTMQEIGPDGTTICDSNASTSLTDANNTNATCSTINKYGGNLNMAASTASTTVNTTSVTTSIQIKNTGTLAANSFTLAPGACTQSLNATPVPTPTPLTAGANGSATDFCRVLKVKIVSGSTTIFDDTAAVLATTPPIDLVAKLGAPVAAGATVPFTFTTSIDPAAGNSYQGLQASQPLTWTFNA